MSISKIQSNFYYIIIMVSIQLANVWWNLLSGNTQVKKINNEHEETIQQNVLGHYNECKKSLS